MEKVVELIILILLGCNCTSITGQNGPYFLPNSLTPLSYQLYIYTNVGVDKFQYWGRVEMQVNCNENTNTITFHAGKEISISSDLVRVFQDKNIIQINKQGPDGQNDLYIINLKDNLLAGTKYNIHIPFQSFLRDDNTGYYQTTYQDEKDITKFMALTQFSYIDARSVYPCFDQPNLKANFIVTIAHSDQYFALSNMPIGRTYTEKDDETGIIWTLDEFKETPAIAPSSVGWALFNLQHTETQQSKVKINVYARAEVMERVKVAQDSASGGLAYFASFFKYDYPLEQINIIFVPAQYDPAYSSLGLFLFSEELLLVDEKTTTAYMKFYTVSTTCFEMCQQWTTDVIATNVWWEYNLWLTAAVPTYLKYPCTNSLNKDWIFIDYTIVDKFIDTLTEDAKKDVLPVSRQVTDLSNLDDLIDDIVYDKGSLLLRMVNLFIGDQVFQEGFAEYISAFKYKSATADDLWNSLTGLAEKAGALPQGYTMKKVMDQWSQQSGGPLVIAIRNYDQGTITLTQKRFLFQVDQENNNLCWPVPLSMATSLDPNFENTFPQHWLTCEGELTFKTNLDKNQWIIFNNKLMVPARFHYDEDQWLLLQGILLDEKQFTQIETYNRVQLLSDMAGLAWSGLLDYQIAFDTYTYLKYETEYFPWLKLYPLLGGIRLYIYKANFLDAYNNYVQDIVLDKFQSFQDISIVPEDDVQLQFKKLVIHWTCVFDFGDCRQQCLNIFLSWFNEPEPDKNKPIPVDFRFDILCFAIAKGNQDHWDFLWNRYLNSRDRTEREEILQAIGCSQDVRLLNRALDLSLDKKVVRVEDSHLVFRGISDNDIGYAVLKDFLFKRFQDIFNNQDGDETRISDFLHVFSLYTITQDDLNNMKIFFDSIKEQVPGLQSLLERDISAAQENVDWFEKYEGHFNRIFVG